MSLSTLRVGPNVFDKNNNQVHSKKKKLDATSEFLLLVVTRLFSPTFLLS